MLQASSTFYFVLFEMEEQKRGRQIWTPDKCSHVPKCGTRNARNSRRQRDKKKADQAAQQQANQEDMQRRRVIAAAAVSALAAACLSLSVARPPPAGLDRTRPAPVFGKPTKTTQKTMFQMFGSPMPQPPPSPTTTHQEVTQAFFWFRGYPSLKGIPDDIYNGAQKWTAKIMKGTPMPRLVGFVGAATEQASQKLEPALPEEYKDLMTKVQEKPQQEYVAPVLQGRTPLKFMCARWLLPRWDRSHVVRSVIFFADTGMNEARAAAKEIVRAHMKESVQLLCALQIAQEQMGKKSVPTNFPELFRLGEQAREAPQTKGQLIFAHDCAKVLSALYCLQNSHADSEFPKLCNLLGQCNAPGMQNAYGTSRKVCLSMQYGIVRRELGLTANGLVMSPVWGLITDGAHKKHMRGAPDIVKVRYICMETGTVHQRHMGLVTPKDATFLEPGTTDQGNVRLVEKPLSAARIGKQIRGELQFLMKHGDSSVPLQDILIRMIVVATDRASSMSGCKGGLAAVLKKLGAKGVPTNCFRFRFRFFFWHPVTHCFTVLQPVRTLSTFPMRWRRQCETRPKRCRIMPPLWRPSGKSVVSCVRQICWPSRLLS